MKYLSSLLIVFSLVLFTSCDDEPVDDVLLQALNNQNNQPGDAVFKADFSGETWVADNVAAQVGGDLIRIVANKSNGQNFAFILDGVSLGTYPAKDNLVTFTPAGSTFGYWGVNPDNDAENTGSVTITSINTANHTLSGFFSFKGYWSDTDVTNILPIVFSNGIFTDVPYTDVSATADTFYAKVDGTEFVDDEILTLEITAGSDTLIAIGASNAADDSITIAVNSTYGTGTYPINPANVNQTQARYVVGGVTKQAQSGSITITEKTATRIKGTFSFVTNGSPTANVTQGQFDVEY